MSELQCAEGARNRWRVGRYTFERWPHDDRWPGSGGRWGCNADGRGVANYRTPVGAWLALRRWLREPARPCE